jgi:hypothetical protein
MNEKGAEALVEAAMRGIRQVRQRFQTDRGEVCAMGALHLARHGWDLGAAWECVLNAPLVHVAFLPCGFVHEYGVADGAARLDLIYANDTEGWDFLTIARKLRPPSGEAGA